MVAGRGGTDRMHDGRAGNDVWAVIHTAILTANYPTCIIKPAIIPAHTWGRKNPTGCSSGKGTPQDFFGA